MPTMIRDNLELCGMSADDLGKAMGIHNSNIYNWVNGKCLPSLPATTAMARIFGTTVELLATGEEA